MLTRMGQLLERLGRGTLALDHLRLAWALAAREKLWAVFADGTHQEVAAFLERHASEPDLSPEKPDAPPDPEPLLARCREAWAETRR